MYLSARNLILFYHFFKILKNFFCFLNRVRFCTFKLVFYKTGFSDVFTLDHVWFLIPIWLSISQHVHSIERFQTFGHSLKLDKSRAKSLREIVISLILQRMCLIVISLFQGLSKLGSCLLSFRLFNKFRIIE